MTTTAGVDIGSTASKVVILVDGVVRGEVVGDSTTNPARTARDIYQAAIARAGIPVEAVDFVVGTGYGRTQVPFADTNISEITCHGRGAFHLRPSVRTVIDIGGQDTKVISVDGAGNLLDFAMNDKCAAGTGRFLEAMARSMAIPLAEMEDHYFGDGDACRITSMCSVFAESEVINLINDGVPMARIIKGLLQSLTNRVASLSRRLGLAEEVVMTGGVAKNRGVRDALARKLKTPLADFGAADPQLVGALGAALIAADLSKGGRGPSGP